MPRYFIELSYQGTDFYGWQRQPDRITIQEAIEENLSKLMGNVRTPIMGAGRTDAGVHAKQLYAHFDASTVLDTDTILFKLNHMLPKSIAIHKIFPVDDQAHTRFDAVGRSYEYHIHRRKNVFLSEYSWWLHQGGHIDFELLKAGAALIPEYSDFKLLSKFNPDNKTTICHLTESRWEFLEDGSHLVYHISANRFLHGMVRRITGLLIAIGQGKLTIEEFKTNMQGDQPFKVNLKAPANGLFLTKVSYPYIA